MVLSEKSNKQTKSHSVKKSEILCCKLNFEVHFRKRKNLRKRRVYAGFGADSRTRTDDLIITNDLLYQLSHISELLNFVKQFKQLCHHKFHA